jgi:hypothetical protein
MVATKTKKTKINSSELVGEAKPITDLKLYIQIEDPSDNLKLTQLRDLCIRKPGLSQVILVFMDGIEKTAMRMPFRCELKNDLLTDLKSIFGDEHVKTA